MNYTRILTQALFIEVQYGKKQQNPLKGKWMSRLLIQGINDYLEKESSC